MDVPDPVTGEWLEATVPGLSEADFAELLVGLRRQGFSQTDLDTRVAPLRVPGQTVAETTTGPPEATVIDPAPSAGGPTIIDGPAGTSAPTVLEDPGPSQPSQPMPIAGRLAPGSVFAGFVIEEVAGRGGMGVVYRARQLRPARTVALKVMSSELASDPDFRGRFERESEISASIEHSNVIPVYGVGAESDLLFIAMRYVEGTDLQATITAAGRLEPRRAVGILAQVTSALDAAHARGLVHRDVKPANVLMAREGAAEHVYLTDFGLAKSLAPGGATRTGLFVGTIDYAAPEQFEAGPIDARTDVYAAGCMLYYALTGRAPFPADSEAGKMRGHLFDEPPSPRAVDPSLPAQLDEVTRRAMAKKPDDRYLSAGDLGRAALAAIEGRATTRAERSVATGSAAPGGPTSPVGAGTSPIRGTSPRQLSDLPRWLKLGAPVLALALAAVVVALVGAGGTGTTNTVTQTNVTTPTTQSSAGSPSGPPAPPAPFGSPAGGQAEITQDAEAKSRLLRLVGAIKACAQTGKDYQTCGTPGTLAIGVPIGTGRGLVQVTVTSPATFEMASTSESDHVFRYSVTVEGDAKRTCTPLGSGGCSADGLW